MIMMMTGICRAFIPTFIAQSSSPTVIAQSSSLKKKPSTKTCPKNKEFEKQADLMLNTLVDELEVDL
jgi:hypothetical protein